MITNTAPRIESSRGSADKTQNTSKCAFKILHSHYDKKPVINFKLKTSNKLSLHINQKNFFQKIKPPAKEIKSTFCLKN